MNNVSHTCADNRSEFPLVSSTGEGPDNLLRPCEGNYPELPLVFLASEDPVKSFSSNEFVTTPVFNKLATDLHERLGCKDPMTLKFICVVLQAIKLFDHKQQAYGTGNISAFGTTGIIVRANDKIQRLINFWKKGSEPAVETINSTWADLGVYSFIAILCRMGEWPGTSEASYRK